MKDARILVVFAFSVGLGFGMIERSVPLRMSQYGEPTSAAGLFMAVLAIGSVIGGVFVSMRPIGSRNAWKQASILFAVFALSVIPSALAPTALTFGICLFINALALVPLGGIGMAEVEARLGKNQRAEAFSWYVTSGRIGGGLAGTAGGLLLGGLPAWQLPLVSSAIFGAMSVFLAVVARQERRRRAADRKEGQQ